VKLLLRFLTARYYCFITESCLILIHMYDRPYSTPKYRRAPVSSDSLSAVCRGPKKFENYRNKRFISFKMRAKRVRALTWWNPADLIRPVLDSSFFLPVPRLPRRTCLYSASSVLAVCMICRIVAVFVFREPLFINYQSNQSNNSLWTFYIYNSTLHAPILCLYSASCGWASDTRNMSRLWVLINWKWLWSVSSWCVL
jgi:hypothetical protein